MEKFPKFIKNIAKIATVSAISFLPNQLEGQNTINTKEISEQLTHQIFDNVKSGFENGILKNSPENAYFFNFQNDEYNISYDLDADYDNQKDEDPTIEVDYFSGNSNYILKQSPKTDRSKDLVYNYKDNSLSDAQTKSYGDFVVENMIIIGELTPNTKYPVNFREINKKEKQQILTGIEKIIKEKGVDSTVIEENYKNIQEAEVKKEIAKQKELQEKETSDIAQNLLNNLKNNENLKNKKFDEISMMTIISNGPYIYKFDNSQFHIIFTGEDGNKTEIKFEINNNNLYMYKARKIIETEKGFKIEDLSNSEAQKIINNTFTEIH